MTERSLVDEAATFAARLSETVRAVAPDCPVFSVRKVRDRVAVEQEPNTGIALCVDGTPLLTLKVSMHLQRDSYGTFAAVEHSSFEVYQGTKASREPLFRYDYVRRPQSEIPAAHVQVHAHRDAVTYVMTQCGTGTKRGRRRARSSDVPQFSELHFPLGGHRFRPCLEDLLEMLVCEFGIDCTPEGREALQAGREHWRRQQTRSVVRDAPEEAAAILEEVFGYRIERPGAGAPPSNVDRLRAL